MYKKVMVPLDGSKLAECVFPHLETVVKGCQGTPEIVLVMAVEPIAVPVGREVSQFSSLDQVKEFEIHQKTDAERYLKDKVAYLKERGIDARTEIVFGRAGSAVTDLANKGAYDLIIIATHGRSGITRLVWGSVAEHILRNVGAPVLMVRALKTSGG